MPGDVIVYLPLSFRPKVLTQIPSKRTGMHMMVAEEIIEIEEDFVRLRIVDCTRYPHAKEDSREKGGIGMAEVTITSLSEGYSLQWGSRKKSWKKELFFARLQL